MARPDDEIDHAAIREAAKIADADSFLAALPAGYQTLLSRDSSADTSSPEGSGRRWPLRARSIAMRRW